MKGFHLFKCLSYVVGQPHDGVEEEMEDVSEKCAVFQLQAHHLVLRLCEKWPHEQQFAVTFASEKTKWRFLESASCSQT